MPYALAVVLRIAHYAFAHYFVSHENNYRTLSHKND